MTVGRSHRLRRMMWHILNRSLLVTTLLVSWACGNDSGGPGDSGGPVLEPTTIDRLQAPPDSCTLGVPTELKAVVKDANGSPVPGVVVTFTVETGNGTVSPTTSTTDANGIAATVFTCAPPVGGGPTVVVASFEGVQQSNARWALGARAGALARIDFFAAGRPDSMPVATGFTQPLSLLGLLRDGLGGSPPATVTWEIFSGGGSLSHHSTEAGECSIFPGSWDLLKAWCVFNTWTLGAMEPEVQAIRLSSPDAPEFEQRFHVRVMPGPFTIIPEPSSDLRGEAGSVLPTPLAVRVLDGNGTPIPRVVVLFLVRGEIEPINPADTVWNSDYVYTDANGRAAMRYTFPTKVDPHTYTIGTHVFIIAEDGQPGRAGWSLSVLPGPPVQLELVLGNDQSGSVGQPLAEPLTVVVLDRFGNGVGGQSVTWAVASGGGSLAESTTISESAGHQNFWTLGPTPGVQSATASFGGITV
ncbi:MAG TPA: Ig-like domain-containing protein, partial [Gemmatimonadales bacterium]|nr:Ig-like domain-containing protein [Gemmatimonadales bacterium]